MGRRFVLPGPQDGSFENDSCQRFSRKGYCSDAEVQMVLQQEKGTETISHSTRATPPLDVSVLFQGNSDEDD